MTVSFTIAPITDYVKILGDGASLGISVLLVDLEAPLSDSDRTELRIIKSCAGVSLDEGKSMEDIQQEISSKSISF